MEGPEVGGATPPSSNIAMSAQLMKVSCFEAHPRQQSPSGAHPHVFPTHRQMIINDYSVDKSNRPFVIL